MAQRPGTPVSRPARAARERSARHDVDLPVRGTTTSNRCCGIASVSCIGTLSGKKRTTRSSRRSGRAGPWLRRFDPGLDDLHPGALEVLLIAGHDRQSIVQNHRRDQPVHRGETGGRTVRRPHTSATAPLTGTTRPSTSRPNRRPAIRRSAYGVDSAQAAGRTPGGTAAPALRLQTAESGGDASPLPPFSFLKVLNPLNAPLVDAAEGLLSSRG